MHLRKEFQQTIHGDSEGSGIRRSNALGDGQPTDPLERLEVLLRTKDVLEEKRATPSDFGARKAIDEADDVSTKTQSGGRRESFLSLPGVEGVDDVVDLRIESCKRKSES